MKTTSSARSRQPGPRAACLPCGAERRGVLLLVVLSMLTLFMMLGAAYLVVASRSRETARAYARLSLRSDNVRLPHSQILDTVMLRVLRGEPANFPALQSIDFAQPGKKAFAGAGGLVIAPAAFVTTSGTYRFESILADKYGFDSLRGTAESQGGGYAVVERAPLLLLPQVRFDSLPAQFHEFDLAGRLVTLLGPGRDPSSHRILRATSNVDGSFSLAIDNLPRNRQFELPPVGQSCAVVVNGREFSGDGTTSPNEPWDAFDDKNPFLSAVFPRDLQNESDPSRISVSSSVVRKAGFVQSGTSSAALTNLSGSASGFDYAADNDNDGVKDGYYLDFSLPTTIAPNGDQITLHASVLVVDLDGRVNVNAHGSLVPVVYPQTVKSGTHALWLNSKLPAGFPTGGAIAVPTGSGYGPPEVNLDLLFPPETSPAATYSFARLQGGPVRGFPTENPLLYLRTGVTASRMAGSASGRSPPTSRFYSYVNNSLSTTPQLVDTEGRYGSFIDANGNKKLPTSYSPSTVPPSDTQMAIGNTAFFTPPGVWQLNDPLSAVNDHRSPLNPTTSADPLKQRTTDYLGIPPAWWDASRTSFNWADNGSLSATTLGTTWQPPIPRTIYNSPPDLHGRMKTYTVAAASNGMLPQLCFLKPEWSRTDGSGAIDVETRDDPYEIRLDTRAPRNAWLKSYGAASPSGNVFNLSELENILRPYDIDSAKLPPRLEALLGSLAEEARLRITTDSWDTTAITGTAANAIATWVKALPSAVKDNPSELYGTDATATVPAKKGLLNRELARMERFDLNRPLTGKKSAGTYDIGDPYYAQRQAYFKDLFILLVALSNDGKGGLTGAQIDRIAQWAANAVEFRDADSTMTPFEYDSNPLDGWSVDGDAKTVDGGQRKLVFGAERPELVITETSAWEDGTTGELFIMLHRPWNAQAFARLTAGDSTSDRAIPAEACDPQFDSYHATQKNPLDRLDLGRKAGTGNLATPIGTNTNVTSTTTYPIWRLRIVDDSGATRYVRCDVQTGAANEYVLQTVTNATTPSIGADGWLCLQGTNSLPAPQTVTYSGGAGAVTPKQFKNFFVAGTCPASGAANRTAVVYLERLTDPASTPIAADWTADPTTAPSSITAAQLGRNAVYRVVDQAKIEIVNRRPDAAGNVPPTKVAMKVQRRTDDAAKTFWNNGNPTVGAAATTYGNFAVVLSTQLGPWTATQKPSWFPWPNRPFVGTPELFLVHALDCQTLLRNYTKPSFDTGATPDHWTAAFLKTIKVTTLPDAVGVPTRFAGIHVTSSDPSGNLATFAGIDQVSTPVNQLSSFREPGRVNLNTVGADDVWNAVVAGPLAKLSGGSPNPDDPDPVKTRTGSGATAANFAQTPLQSTAGLLALAGGPPTAGTPRVPIQDTNGVLATAIPLNAAQGLYTATRLANTATTRSHLFGVWITLRESTASATTVNAIPSDPDAVRYHRAFYVIDRSIPVAHEPGRDHNVWDAVLLRRIIE